MKRSRVFVTGSLWSLLIYLVVSEEEDIKRSKYFFLTRGIHASVRKNFKYVALDDSWSDKLPWKIFLLSLMTNPIYKRIKYPYLCFADIYGIDQGAEIQSIIGRRNYTLIEDGIIDYSVDRNLPNTWKSRVQRLLFGAIYRHDIGRNNQCKHIVLTQPFSNPKLKEKAKHYDLQKLWQESSETKRELILRKFNITPSDLEMMSKKTVILLTQPLSEDNIMSEEEKIQLYRDLVAPYGEANVLIKPHPREKTDYSKALQKSMCFDKIVPFQLFSLIGLKFDTVVTICSTAALSLQSTGTKIDFKGSRIDERIVAAYGDVNINSYR